MNGLSGLRFPPPFKSLRPPLESQFSVPYHFEEYEYGPY